MNTRNTLGLTLAALLGGCLIVGDDAGGNDSGDSTGNSTTATTTATTTASTTTASTTDTTTASTSASTTMADSSGGSEGSSSSTTEDPSTFHFDETPPDQYIRVDRMGFPAINTGLHIHGDKDAYNASDPVLDIEDYFDDSVAEVANSVLLLHYGPDLAAVGTDGLDDELNAILGPFTPSGTPACTPPSVAIAGQCIDQGGGLAAFPDTLELYATVDVPQGFHIDPNTCRPVPNGRYLADPVIDIILAVLLLDLAEQPYPEGEPVGLPCDPACDPDADDCPNARATTFLNLPGSLIGMDGVFFSLNPSQNDQPFGAEFPYLAPANAPM